MRAMPSPTSTTVPTERVSMPASNWSMADLMIWVMSSERMAIDEDPRGALQGAGCELAAQSLQAPPDAAVDQSVPDADLHAPQERLVDGERDLHLTSHHAGQPLRDRGHLRLGERCGARDRCLGDALPPTVETPEL